MIQTFADKETKKIFTSEFSEKLPENIQRTAMRKLWMIDAAYQLQDLRIPPSNHLEKLSEKKKGTIAYESIFNGEYLSNGRITMPTMWASSIIIKTLERI